MIFPWKRLVVWGGGHDLASHRHIHAAFYENARKLGIPGAWFRTRQPGEIQAGDLVIGADIWSADLPVVKGAQYVLHNVTATDRLFDELEPDQFIRLQVYTNEAHGEQWDETGTRFWVAENRTLIQPWGTNLLAEEAMDPVYNPSARDCVFVGAIWDDGGLGNDSTIGALSQTLAKKGYQFVHLTQVPEEEMIQAVRGARFAPALVGPWQEEHDYLPCRSFKGVSYGVLNVSNVAKFADLMPSAPLEGGVSGIVDWALSMRREPYLEMVREQQRVVSKHFTYRESLESIARAFAA